MTKAGNIISVEAKEAEREMPELLRGVEREGNFVRIYRNGKPVAELRPAASQIDPLRQHPELMGVKFNADPSSPIDEQDWPAELR